MQNLKKVQNCAEALSDALPKGFSPKAGLVLGTGLGDLGNILHNAVSVPYTALPDFPQSTVASHQGRFLAGELAGVPVLLQQGRCHLYEGRTPAEVCTGVRVMATMGIGVLALTNAAGALNPRFSAGDLMLVEDQINFTGQSPLAGPNVDSWGLRFPDVSDLYDSGLAAHLADVALALGIRLERGVYLCIPGPQLETRAETRAYRLLGADAVGMSTALEALAAFHMGVKVAAVSCLTNKNLPDCMEKASIEQIVQSAQKSSAKLRELLVAALPGLVGLI
jgi:purine-nucleoside phosphorylase